METPITSNNAILSILPEYIYLGSIPSARLLAYTMLDYNRQASTIKQATSINH